MRKRQQPPRLRKWIERLKNVETARFSAQKLLKSSGELGAFYAARNLCGEFARPSFYVMAQLSLGEILEAESSAYSAINWMRCDVAIIDTDGTPLAIIEVQGHGHYGGLFEEGLEVRIKDEIKRKACASAGIQMIEVHANALNSTYREVKARLSSVLEAQLS